MSIVSTPNPRHGDRSTFLTTGRTQGFPESSRYAPTPRLIFSATWGSATYEAVKWKMGSGGARGTEAKAENGAADMLLFVDSIDERDDKWSLSWEMRDFAIRCVNPVTCFCNFLCDSLVRDSINIIIYT